MAEFGTPETWNMKVGDFLEQKEFTIPQEKPQALLDLQEQNRKQRLLDSLQKIGPGLMDESLDFIRRENFDKGGAAEIRKYLNSVKKGSTVDVGAYLDKNNFVEPRRSNVAATFRRVAPEFEDKNLNLKYRSVSEALRAKEPLSKQFKKVANHFFKDEIAEYDSIEDWAYAKENRSDRLEIIRGIKTKGKKGIVIGRYKKPKADLKIKASYDPKTRKVIGVSFPSKEMEKEFIEKIKEVYTKPKGQGYSSKDFARDFPVNANTANKIINDYYQPEKKMGLKYPKGKTVGKGSTQLKSEKLGDTSVDAVERAILKEKRELSKDLGLTRPVKGRAGMTERTTIDLAHRISKDHAKELGLKFGTETTGFDSRLINQVILRPVERELEILYAKQRKLRTQFQEGKAPKNYEKRMNDLNAEINKQIKLTNGRMIGVNIDPNTNEVSFTGQKKKFKLSNLDLTFEQIKDLPKDEKQKIITDSVLKGVEAEKARGFRPYDFRTLLSSPERRKEVLKYAKTNAPDIFSKVKQAISNPESKQRFALYSKLPTALIPVGMTLAFASQSGEARADEPGVEDEDSILPEAAIATAAAAPLATKTGRNIYGTTGKGLLKALRVLGQPSVAAGFAADELRQGNIKTAGASLLAPELVGSLAPAGRGILSTIGRIAANPFGKAARAFTPVGLATIGAGALKDVYDEYQRREALTDEERLAEDIERDRAADEMMIGAAEGGRIGFADGPDDPSKRKFMKLMGIMSLLPFGIGKGIKMATKAAPVVAEGAKLGFDNFLQLMIKIKAFGKEDPTRATLERQKATIYTGKDGSEYELIEDMSTGDIRITRDKPGMASSGDEVFDTIEDRSTFELKVGQADETTKGKKPPDEYDEGKTIFDQDGTPADVDEIDDATIKAIKDEIN